MWWSESARSCSFAEPLDAPRLCPNEALSDLGIDGGGLQVGVSKQLLEHCQLTRVCHPPHGKVIPGPVEMEARDAARPLDGLGEAPIRGGGEWNQPPDPRL